jgi:hypothetical protein
MEVLINLVSDPKTGVAVVLGFMWWKANARAEALEAEKAALLERVVTAMYTNATSITGMTASMDDVKDLVQVSLDKIRRDQ